MTNNNVEFAHALTEDETLTELEMAVHTSWFLCARDNALDVELSDVVGFLREYSVRPNINTSRLKAKLKNDRAVTISPSGVIHLPRKTSNVIADRYAHIFAAKPKIEDGVLVAEDFTTSRKYVSAIVRQVNGSYQMELFDACAVMMRRLAEVLIIEAYAAKRMDNKIRGADGNLKMMNGLIGALNSGATFKLSRNAPTYLEQLKNLGDTAAHSRTYITKQKDIDDFSHKFRMLIQELLELN